VDQISNAQTAADYSDALTLGPSNYDAISVNVWNNSCVSQTFELDAGGNYQLGSWGAESLDSANSTYLLQNCGGVRFKTNPNTPATPARIVAYAWKSGDVQKIGGIQLAGTISASGNVTPSSGLITGIIPTLGTTPTGGTGFTYTHVNGSGIYDFTFTTPFAAPPTVVATGAALQAGSAIVIEITNLTANGFRANPLNSNNGAGSDNPFSFIAAPTQ